MRHAPPRHEWGNFHSELKQLKTSSNTKSSPKRGRINVVANQTVPKFLQQIIYKNSRVATQLPDSMQHSAKALVEDAERLLTTNKELQRVKLNEDVDYQPVIANLEEFDEKDEVLNEFGHETTESGTDNAKNEPNQQKESISFDQSVGSDTHSTHQDLQPQTNKHTFKPLSKKRTEATLNSRTENAKRIKLERTKANASQLSFDLDDEG